MKLHVVACMAICVVFMLNFLLPRQAGAFQPFLTGSGRPFVWDMSTLSGNTIFWKVDAAAPAMVRESMIDITRKWSDAAGGTVKFAEGSGGIEVTWDPDGSKIFDTLFLAYTTFSADQAGKITRAYVIVNAATYNWQRGGYGGVGPFINGRREANLDSVLLHELGHALGLDHSDKNPSAIIGTIALNDLPTMNSVIYPGAETLHMDDEAGIRTIYLVPPDAVVEPEISITASPQSGRRPLTTSLTLHGGDASALWNFGDGSSSAGETVTHKFTALGSYVVTARCNGKTATITIEVEKKSARQKAGGLKKRKYRSGYSSTPRH